MLEVLAKAHSGTAQVKWSCKGLFHTWAPPGGKYKAFAQGIGTQLVCLPQDTQVVEEGCCEMDVLWCSYFT